MYSSIGCILSRVTHVIRILRVSSLWNERSCRLLIQLQSATWCIGKHPTSENSSNKISYKNSTQAIRLLNGEKSHPQI
jgi:hypothetical protein